VGTGVHHKGSWVLKSLWTKVTFKWSVLAVRL